MARRDASDRHRDDRAASIAWTQGPHDQRIKHVLQFSLKWIKIHRWSRSLTAEIIPARWRSMDSPINHDRSIKIQPTNQIEASPLHQREIKSRPFIVDRTSKIWSRRFAKRRTIATVDRDQLLHPTAQNNFVLFKNGSSRRRTRSRSIFNYSLYTPSNRAPFVRECSWLIKALIECLKSNIYWRRRKKLHLELHFRLWKFGMKSLASGD